jgi:hypothetical protein
MAEQLTLNQLVEGSSPSRCSWVALFLSLQRAVKLYFVLGLRRREGTPYLGRAYILYYLATSV